MRPVRHPALLLLPLVLAASAGAQPPPSPAAARPTGDYVPPEISGMTRPQSSELRELVERFVADRDELVRFYSVNGSAAQVRRLREFYAAWSRRLEAMPYESLALKTMPNFRDMKDHVEMTVTMDGLRIELLETEAGMFFESGRPLPSATGTALLARLAEELGKLPNTLLIEGHTDAKPFANKDGYYSNWELSTDRANSARRLMEEHGIRHEQVAQVRGFADRQLRHPDDPIHPSNRRISVIVHYLAPPPAPPTAPAEPAKKPAH